MTYCYWHTQNCLTNNADNTFFNVLSALSYLNRRSVSIIHTPNRLISYFFFYLPIRQLPSPLVYFGNVSCSWNSQDEYVRNQDP